MPGKDVVTQFQPPDLSKDAEHSEVEPALNGEAAGQEEDHTCGS